MNRQFITEFWIDDEDYQKELERLRELKINLIEEHDSEIRKDERAKTIEEIGIKLCAEIHFGYEVEERVCEVLEQLKEKSNEEEKPKTVGGYH